MISLGFVNAYLIEEAGQFILIDTGYPDSAPKLLKAINELERSPADVQHILVTHCHADHIHGFDDLRAFTFGSDRKIPVYGNPPALRWVREHFRYIWEAKQVMLFLYAIR